MTERTKDMVRQILALPAEQQAVELRGIKDCLDKCEKYGQSYSGFIEPDVLQAGRILHRILRKKY